MASEDTSQVLLQRKEAPLPPETDYGEFSVPRLREEIKIRGLSFKSRRKADLVDFLKASDQESTLPNRDHKDNGSTAVHPDPKQSVPPLSRVGVGLSESELILTDLLPETVPLHSNNSDSDRKSAPNPSDTDSERESEVDTANKESITPTSPTTSPGEEGLRRRILEEDAPTTEEVDRGDRTRSKQMEEDRRKIVLWRRPLTTLLYFVLELKMELQRLFFSLVSHWRAVVVVAMAALLLTALFHMDGPHQQVVSEAQKQVLWCLYWVGLGVLSSVGLGTGLHTFLLYLGPHIVSVTLAAWSCGSLDFPQPPYPNEIHCPGKGDEEQTAVAAAAVSILSILYKVKLEAFMWGAGTAIGELPPYFMARTARLSGQEDEEFEELEEELQARGLMSSLKRGMHNFVQRVGFPGILLAASIPNPLFDLAGITCGHFLVPFWTFFGATLIGKAVIKILIQAMFTIVVFSKDELEWILTAVRSIPFIGVMIETPLKELLESQKKKYTTPAGQHVVVAQSNLQWILEKAVMVMVVYFVCSIVNSMAQAHAKRLSTEQQHSSAQPPLNPLEGRPREKSN